MHLRLSLVITCLLSSSVFSTKWLDCGPPRSYLIELENQQKVSIYNAEINVNYDSNELKVHEYSNLDFSNFFINETTISFMGQIANTSEEFDFTAFKTHYTFNSKIAGTVKLTKNRSSNNATVDCSVHLSRNFKESSGIPRKVQNLIFDEASTCIKSTLCQKLSAAASKALKKAANSSPRIQQGNEIIREENSVFNFDTYLSPEEVKSVVASYTSNNVSLATRNGLQSTVNTLVDLAITKIIKLLLQNTDNGKIKIEDMYQPFVWGPSWWPITGEFIAHDGTFEDISTLVRRGDVDLTTSGLKFDAACEFLMTRVFIQYKYYKARWGIFSVSGDLSANIDGVAAAAAAGVDYNQEPCRAHLNDFRITEIGKLSLKVTGLGPLNGLLSNIATWMAINWQNTISSNVEARLREMTNTYLNQFDCERYRP